MQHASMRVRRAESDRSGMLVRSIGEHAGCEVAAHEELYIHIHTKFSSLTTITQSWHSASTLNSPTHCAYANSQSQIRAILLIHSVVVNGIFHPLG